MTQPTGYFVIGTDTGVGKTVVACGLLRAFAARGLRSIGMKPVAAGLDADGINEDVKHLLAAGNVAGSAAAINPYALPLAVSPHLAAAAAGIDIALPTIITAYRQLAAQADVVIVEGAGGLRAPISSSADMADLAMALGLPVILVVGIRLGCLNHALLTHEALQARGLRCAGWVGNVLDAAMPLLQENLATLRQRLPAPCLGVVPAALAKPEQGFLQLAVDLLPH